MTIALASQFHVYLQWNLFSMVSFNSVLNVKALMGNFNQEKALVGPDALVGAFSMIVKFSRTFV